MVAELFVFQIQIRKGINRTIYYNYKYKDLGEVMAQQQQAFSLQALIFVLILVVYVLTSHLVEVKKVSLLHQSSVAIIMGLLTALFLKFAFTPSIEIKFSGEIFFTIILPPIIFSAGYSLRKSLFFQNFGIIAFLGILGTILSFIFLSLFIRFIDYFIFNVLTLKQVLMISSVLCATDTIAAMSLIKPHKYPILNAILFGEGIINDAVAIILFRTVNRLTIDPTNTFDFSTFLEIVFSFCYLFFFSVALGLVTGFGLSYLLKINPSFTKHPLKQVSLILLNGYTTYLIGEQLNLSGIISLFTCAVVMGHYCFMNISEESQRTTGLAFETVSYLAQAFVFTYLGASMLNYRSQWLAAGMSATILLCFPLARAGIVYLLPCIYKLRKKQFPLDSKDLKVCWYSGMIRGVIAFALCLQINTQHQLFIQTVTMVIVVVTTLLGATMLMPFAKFIGMQTSESDEQEDLQVYNKMNESMNKRQTLSEMTPSNYRQINLNYQSDGLSNQKDEDEQQNTNRKSFWVQPIFNKKQLSYSLDDQINTQQNTKL